MSRIRYLQRTKPTPDDDGERAYCQVVYASGCTLTAAAHHYAALRLALRTNVPTFEGVDEYDCPIMLRLDDAISVRLVTAECLDRMAAEDRQRDLGF